MMKLIYDAGHGGRDPGAGSGTICESDIALAVVLSMDSITRISHPEWDVVLTRCTDVYMSPSARRRMCMLEEPSAFVSIHCNAADSAKANGFEVIYREQDDYNLGIMIEEVFLQEFPTVKKRGLKHDLKDLGRDLAVLSTPGITSIIVELGFITSPVDIILLQKTSDIATAIIKGIERWVEIFGG